MKGLDHGVAGDRGVDGAGDQVAGVIVEPVEDLDVGAVAKAPVGEVGLPALVGLGGEEALVGGPGSFPGFGGDQPGGVQDPADGRGRRWSVAVLLEVPGQGHRAGVQAVGGQLEAQLDDPVPERLGGGVWVRPWSTGPGVDGIEPAFAVASQEAMQVLSGVSVLGCGGGDRELFGDDLQDSDPGFRHAPGLSPMSRLMCHVSGVAYVVNPGTLSSTSRIRPVARFA